MLVTGMDGADFVRVLRQRVEKVVVMNAGQRVDGVESVGQEGGNGGLAGGHRRARRR